MGGAFEGDDDMRFIISRTLLARAPRKPAQSESEHLIHSMAYSTHKIIYIASHPSTESSLEGKEKSLSFTSGFFFCVVGK